MKMTLDEAIREEKKAEKEFIENAKIYAEQHMDLIQSNFEEAAEHHRQIAEWLEELKQLKGI